ncbi:MAG TPA: lytic transglycosylase domain-containing protein [Solirubrobacteraceae bacterium]|nr:lytic transglycosylase domain-containing protein [Solirubrobacteraceae bacterium]
MSPPAAAATARHSHDARRRQAAARRRRSVLFLGAFGLLLLAVVLAIPLFKKAVNDLGLPLQDQDIIRQQAQEKHLDPALIAAVIYAETKFDPRPSPAGAQGLMQILPETADFLARRSGATTFTPADLATPQVNIAYGSYYLRYLLDSYGGDTMLALAAYNGGQANVDRWVADARAHGHRLTAAEIPFPETRAYVAKVLQAQKDYRRTYPSELGYQ